MTNRRKSPARALAFIALAAGVVAILVVVSSSLEDDGPDRQSRPAQTRSDGGAREQGRRGEGREAPAAYVVQTGDTLSGIAARTGVSIARLQELNPGMDPQILTPGDRLRLR